MSELEEKILLAVKNHFLENKEAVRLDKIYWLFNYYEEAKIRYSIRQLVEDKKVLLLEHKLVPIMEEEKKAEISESKIREIFGMLKIATAQEIVEKYNAVYGKCNNDSLGREIRRMAEAGKIERENGRYFLKGTANGKNLAFFAMR